jgi:hypothetical protein
MQEVAAGGGMKKRRQEANGYDLTIPISRWMRVNQQVNELVRLGKIKKKSQDILPQDPLNRCHRRWKDIFQGILNAIDDYDPRLFFRLLLSLKAFGLTDNIPYALDGGLIEPNPSDEILRKAAAFHKGAKLPSLRGKKIPWENYDPYNALQDFSWVLFNLNTLPKQFNKFCNKDAKFVVIRNRLPMMLEKMEYKVKTKIPEDYLKEWIVLPKREFAVRLAAYVHGYGRRHQTFQKQLTRARKIYPMKAEMWKNGVQINN